MEEKQLKPWHGILTFIVMMVIFLAVAIPVQGKLGLIGVGITELLLLVMAVVAAKLFRQDLKEVFPVRKPKLREVFGTLVFWVGSFQLCMVATLLMTVLFPEEMSATSSGLNEVVTSRSVWLSIFIVSLMPAVCEEAVHRGFILHTFRGVKREWVTVLVMGIIFGVFHTDPMRFLTTAILGACITWVMLKTGNMVLPMLFHAVNNLVPILISVVMSSAAGLLEKVAEQTGQTAGVLEAAEFDSRMYLVALGYYLFISAIAPILLLGGTTLLKPKGEKLKTTYLIIAVVLGAVLAVSGIAIIAANFTYILEIQGLSLEDLGL